MHRDPVRSSVIASVGYSPDENLLQVEFTTGRVYTYHRVPPHVHAALLAARSIGRYFNTRIRDRYAWDEEPR